MNKEQVVVPKKYAGKWIAWDGDKRRVIASGRTLKAAVQAAKAKGENQPQLMKMPPGLFAGSV